MLHFQRQKDVTIAYVPQVCTTMVNHGLKWDKSRLQSSKTQNLQAGTLRVKENIMQQEIKDLQGNDHHRFRTIFDGSPSENFLIHISGGEKMN